MTISGLQKLTLIDYPGKLAATVFLSGCNFRCPFCYSPELVLPQNIKKQPKISEKKFFDFLDDRKNLIEGIVVCGGEPLINKGLDEFIKKIKKVGFDVKLDTNGSNPEFLKKLISKKLIDYVAMDIKGPKEKYKEMTGDKAVVKNIDESISVLKSSGIDHEFRTTIVPGMLSKEDIINIAKWINGADKYYLQNFRSEKNIDPNFVGVRGYTDKYMTEIKRAVSPYFKVCDVR